MITVEREISHAGLRTCSKWLDHRLDMGYCKAGGLRSRFFIMETILKKFCGILVI